MSNHYSHLTPLNDRVIIQPIKIGETIVGGIIIPESVNVQDKPTRGIVVACGPGRVSEHGAVIPMTVKVGDEVIFNFYSASEMNVDDQRMFMVRECEISCVVKK